MSRDELAFQILLKIMGSPDLRESILTAERERALAIPDYVYNPAAAFARVAWIQTDEFIHAGVSDEERARYAKLSQVRERVEPPAAVDRPDWRA